MCVCVNACVCVCVNVCVCVCKCVCVCVCVGFVFISLQRIERFLNTFHSKIKVELSCRIWFLNFKKAEEKNLFGSFRWVIAV